jgi:hypothetical protein
MVSYKAVIRIGNWIYLLPLQSQQIKIIYINFDKSEIALALEVEFPRHQIG